MTGLLKYDDAVAHVKADGGFSETVARTIAAAFMAPERPALVAFATGAEFDAVETAEEAYLENDATYGPDDRRALRYLAEYCSDENPEAGDRLAELQRTHPR